MIIIVFGLPGSGKSFFAKRVAHMLDATYISSDRIRKAMFSKPTYTEESKAKVYAEMLRRMIHTAQHGKEVVLDATFNSKGLRKEFESEGKELTNVYWIEVRSDEILVKARLLQPRDESDADFQVYQGFKDKWEPFKDNHLVLESTNDNILHMLEQTTDYLFSKNDKTKH